MSRASQRAPGSSSSGGSNELERARAAFAQRAWADAFVAFGRADQQRPLADADLQLFTEAAGLSGHDDEMLRQQERLYHLRVEAGDSLRAALVAFWIGLRLRALREVGKSSAWIQRAQRLVEREPSGCAVQGYLLVPVVYAHLNASEYDQAYDKATTATELGERFADRDLVAFGRKLQGRALLCRGEIDRGLALLDEVMLAATSGELSPIVIGLVYCSVIASYHRVYALRRAREWTAALSDWCAAQPQLVPFAGTCLVHRSEIMQLGGAWDAASEEARRCAEGQCLPGGADGIADALYQQAEIQRLRGDLEGAEETYRKASECGREPQPGLALLRLAQGRNDAAQSAIRRVLDATRDPLLRTQFLPAFVEIMLASGELQAAREAAAELEQTAARFDTEIVSALADHASGAVRLADDDARGALEPLRRAFAVWQQLEAPYLAARLRVLIGAGCAALGDHDGAKIQRDAARAVFEQLGAARDLALLASAAKPAAASTALAGATTTEAPAHGLSTRELEVLRLLATGATNKAIAQALFLSEKTVDRHVSNIFDKLDVRTRAAATAYAYENALV